MSLLFSLYLYIYNKLAKILPFNLNTCHLIKTKFYFQYCVKKVFNIKLTVKYKFLIDVDI